MVPVACNDGMATAAGFLFYDCLDPRDPGTGKVDGTGRALFEIFELIHGYSVRADNHAAAFNAVQGIDCFHAPAVEHIYGLGIMDQGAINKQFPFGFVDFMDDAQDRVSDTHAKA